MIFDEAYTLSNGVKIPKLGYGTWFIKDGEVAQAVREAVGIGYRLIDTAQATGMSAAWARAFVPAAPRGRNSS